MRFLAGDGHGEIHILGGTPHPLPMPMPMPMHMHMHMHQHQIPGCRPHQQGL